MVRLSFLLGLSSIASVGALLAPMTPLKVSPIMRGASSLKMISTGDDRSERKSLDISKTTYVSSIKSPKDSYIALAEKGMSNAKMSKRKILHQSILGGCYVGFGGLLSLSVAGNMVGIGSANPGLAKMAFAALFPVNLLLIVVRMKT